MTTDFFALSQPPFDTLDKEQRERLQRHSQIVYLDSLQPIDKQWYGDFFYHHQRAKFINYKVKNLLPISMFGDWFATQIALDNPLDDTTTDVQFITQQQSFTFIVLTKNVFNQIIEENTTLKNLLFADLSARLATRQSRLAQSESQQLLHQPISLLGQHIKPPQFIDGKCQLTSSGCRNEPSSRQKYFSKINIRIKSK